MNISKNRIKVSFLEDKLKNRFEIVVIAEISGFFYEETEPETDKNQLAAKIRDVLFSKVKNAFQVACFIYALDPLNEKHGFSSISKS